LSTLLEYLAGFARELLGDVAFKSILALTGGVFLGVFDWGGVAIKALFWLLCIDFGMGLLRAWSSRQVSGAKLRRGFGKFLLYLLAILVAHHVDQAASVFVTVNFRAFIILYLVLCEALSIFRHLHCLGVPIPRQMIDRLETLRDCDLLRGSGAKERGK
jgi:toxin secretion/phage lysis holin